MIVGWRFSRISFFLFIFQICYTLASKCEMTFYAQTTSDPLYAINCFLCDPARNQITVNCDHSIRVHPIRFRSITNQNYMTDPLTESITHLQLQTVVFNLEVHPGWSHIKRDALTPIVGHLTRHQNHISIPFQSTVAPTHLSCMYVIITLICALKRPSDRQQFH